MSETLTQSIDLDSLIDEIREAEIRLGQCATERQKSLSTLKALEVALADEMAKLAHLGRTENALQAYSSKARNEASRAALAGVTAGNIQDMLEPLAMAQSVQMASGIVTELRDQAGSRTLDLNREIANARIALADVESHFVEAESNLKSSRSKLRILRGA